MKIPSVAATRRRDHGSVKASRRVFCILQPVLPDSFFCFFLNYFFVLRNACMLQSLANNVAPMVFMHVGCVGRRSHGIAAACPPPGMPHQLVVPSDHGNSQHMKARLCVRAFRNAPRSGGASHGMARKMLGGGIQETGLALITFSGTLTRMWWCGGGMGQNQLEFWSYCRRTFSMGTFSFD